MGMLIAGIFLGLIVGAAGGMIVAVWAGREQIGKALKQRDEMIEAMERVEAHALEVESGAALPAEVEEKLDKLKKLEEKPPEEKKGSGNITTGHLKTLSSYDRYVIEEKRLRAGKGPMDPLTGLSRYYKTEIIKLRIHYGYTD